MSTGCMALLVEEDFTTIAIKYFVSMHTAFGIGMMPVSRHRHSTFDLRTSFKHQMGISMPCRVNRWDVLGARRVRHDRKGQAEPLR
jgi:hypothetical protein